MTTLVSEAMNRSPVAVAPDARVADAAALARAAGTAHLLVMDEEHLVGVVCACDLRAPAPGEHVADRMTVPVLTIRPDASVADAVMTMRECRIGCLPVALGGLLLGLVEARDLPASAERELPRRPCHRSRRRGGRSRGAARA